MTLVVSPLCSVLLCLLVLLLFIVDVCVCVHVRGSFLCVSLRAGWTGLPLLGSSLKKEDLEERFYEFVVL